MSLTRLGQLMGTASLLLGPLAYAQTVPAEPAPPEPSPAPSGAPAELTAAPPLEPTPAPPANVPVEPAAPVFVAPGTALPTNDDHAARQVLQTFAGHARTARRIGGVATLVTGAASVTAGLIADLEYEQSYGRVLWIGGGVVSALGVLSLFRESPIEALHDAAPSLTQSALRLHWGELASAAKRSRRVNGAINVALGAAGLGAAAAIAAGVGDMDRSAQQAWTIGLLAVGGGLVGSGIGSIFIESDAEVGYRAAYESETNKPQVSFSAAPAPGGASASFLARW